MHRRGFLLGTAASASLLAAGPLKAQQPRVLKFVPQADLSITDPHFGISFITRNHAHIVYDFLYGLDDAGQPHPQMAAGHTVENDGRTWNITLRDGLKFHDGTPVLARDAIASLRRWTGRDVFGKSLFDDVDTLTPVSDRVMQFKLKKPFRLLLTAFSKHSPYAPAIMPERIAATPSTQAVSEIIGSGPYRYSASERVSGSRAVYLRFEDYKPSPNGAATGTAVSKVANFDRIEWHTLPDSSTAAAALQTGEVDWWEQVPSDLLPALRRRSDIKIDMLDTIGFTAVLRFNHLVPPFNNPAIRRALLGAFSQTDMMTAVAGSDPKLRIENMGYFHPTSPFATNVGMEALTGPRDLQAVKTKLAAAGYNGEVIRLIAPVDLQPAAAMSDVAADVFRRLGVNLEVVSVDWGSALGRLVSKNPIDKGGWGVTCNYTTGVNNMDPSMHAFVRGSGQGAIFGWPDAPKIEQLRQAWMDSTDFTEQKRLCEQIQLQAFEDIPYIPLGGFLLASAYRSNLTGFVRGTIPLFYNVRRT